RADRADRPGGRAAGLRVLFEQDHARTCGTGLDRRREAGAPGTDHDDVEAFDRGGLHGRCRHQSAYSAAALMIGAQRAASACWSFASGAGWPSSGVAMTAPISA